MRLDRPVENGAEHVRRRHFDHGDLGSCRLVARGVHPVGRVQRQQARLIDQDACLRDSLEPHRLLGERLAKGHPAANSFAHQFEAYFRQPDQPHTVVNSARAQPSLGDLEAAAFAQQDVGRGHSDIHEVNLSMSVRGVIKPEDR